MHDSSEGHVPAGRDRADASDAEAGLAAIEDLLEASALAAYARFDRRGTVLRANARFRALTGDPGPGARLTDLVIAGQRERVAALLVAGESSGALSNVHFSAGDGMPTSFDLRWAWDGDELVVLGEPPVEDLEYVEASLFKLNSQVSALARQNVKTSGRLLEDLARSNEELEAANREFQEFAYSIAHELRPPLRALDGFSQVVLEDYTDRLDEAGRAALARIRAASQRMAELLDAQLALARTGRREVELSDVDVTAVARRIVERALQGDRAGSVVCTVAEGLRARTDAVLTASVLDCLLDNAWKFTSGRAEAIIEVGSENRDGEQVFFVRDNGAGFDPAYADKLFRPFEHLHATGEYAGVGMGLATVRRMLERLGGRCWAEGEVDAGATVWFTLSGKR
jgi:signal transduction histidine kinase